MHLNSQFVVRTAPGFIGAGTLVATAIVLMLYLGPTTGIAFVDEGLVISSVCSLGNAIGVLIYRRQNRRAALGFVLSMIGWATVFLGIAMMNRGILGGSLVSLVPAGLMLLGAWYFGSDAHEGYNTGRRSP